MTREKAIEELQDIKSVYENRELGELRLMRSEVQALEMAIQAIENIGHLTDRPCSVCEFKKETGCCKWSCVFDELIYKKEIPSQELTEKEAIQYALGYKDGFHEAKKIFTKEEKNDA